MHSVIPLYGMDGTAATMNRKLDRKFMRETDQRTLILPTGNLFINSLSPNRRKVFPRPRGIKEEPRGARQIRSDARNRGNREISRFSLAPRQ